MGNDRYLNLARKYIELHDTGALGNWSPFDGMEQRAIRVFAEWLDNNPSEVTQVTNIEVNTGKVVGVEIGGLNG